MTVFSSVIRRPIFFILAGALALRFGMLAVNWNNLDFGSSFLLHGEVARNILQGNWFQKDTAYFNQYVRTCSEQHRLIDLQEYPAPTVTSLVPLYNDEGGYGAFLALLWKLTGSMRWWYVRVLQILVDVLLCWMAYRIGSRLFGERVGLMAAVLYAVFIPGIEIAIRPHRDFWVTALYIVSLFLLVVPKQPSLRRMLLLGVFAGVVAMMRSTAVPFVFFLSAAMFVITPSKATIKQVAVLVLGFVLTFSPLIIRNYTVFGKFMATRGAFWHSFWGGVGQVPNPYGVIEDDVSVAQLAFRLSPGVKYESEHYEQVLKAEAVRFVSGNPAWYFGSVLRRTSVFVFPRAGRALLFQPIGEQHKVGFLNVSLGAGLGIMLDCFFGIAFLIALWWKRTTWRQWGIVLVPYLYTLGTLAPFYVTGRNIANVYMTVLLFASLVLVLLFERVLPDRWLPSENPEHRS